MIRFRRKLGTGSDHIADSVPPKRANGSAVMGPNAVDEEHYNTHSDPTGTSTAQKNKSLRRTPPARVSAILAADPASSIPANPQVTREAAVSVIED